MKYIVETWLEIQQRGRRRHYRICLATGCEQIGTLRGETISMPWTKSLDTEMDQWHRTGALAVALGAGLKELDTIKTWRR